MAKVTLGIAAALIALGLITFALTRAQTSLIPAYFGMGLAICGAIALKAEYRKHAMHVAAVIALLGFLLPLGRVIPALVRGRLPATAALVGLVTMIALCGVLLVLFARSFIQARRDRAVSVQQP